MRKFIIFFTFLFIGIYSFAQNSFILTKEGRAILQRSQFIIKCVKSMNKDRTDKTAVSICECKADKLNNHFSNKQFKKYTTNDFIDLDGLFNEDSTFIKTMDSCYTNSGQTILLQAEGFGEEFISNCIKNIRTNSEKTLDNKQVEYFCSCQLDLIKSKKISDSEMKTLDNPNSLLFHEIISKCGDPFSTKQSLGTNWTPSAGQDVQGPNSDTINVLQINGMTYLKVKIGSMIQVWLFDTGASDLLINKEMESILKNENVINNENYLGIGEYEMANGMIDTCRKYKISNIKIGKFSVDNITVAVTEKGKRIIVGKALLNKFSNWTLNNLNNKLILSR